MNSRSLGPPLSVSSPRCNHIVRCDALEFDSFTLVYRWLTSHDDEHLYQSRCPSWTKHDTHSPSSIGEYSSQTYIIQIITIQDIFPDISHSLPLLIQTKACSNACSKACLLYNQAEEWHKITAKAVILRQGYIILRRCTFHHSLMAA